VPVEDWPLAVRRIGPRWACGGDQPLVVEERSAERRLEEVVGDRVVRVAVTVQVRIDRQGGRVVVTHREADGVASGHVAVLIPIVQLVLLLVEAVDYVAGAAAGQVAVARRKSVRCKDTRLRTRPRARRDVRLDVERLDGEMAREGGACRRVCAKRTWR